MPNELKIVIDADVSKAIAGVQNLSKVITADFTKATNAASASASNLSSDIAASIQKINSLKIKSSFGDLGAVSLDSSQVQSAIETLKSNLASLQARIPITITAEGLDKLNTDIAKAKADLNSLISKNIKVDVDATAALQKITLLKGNLAAISNVPFKFDTSKGIKGISDLQDRVHRLDQSLKTTTGLNSFHAALGKSTIAVKNLQATGVGLNSFYANLVTQNNRAVSSLNRLPQSSNQATNALTNLGRVVQDAPFGFLGIANNLNPLVESFQRLKVTAGTTGGALKALGSSLLGPAGIGIAISVVSSLLVVFGDRIFNTGKKANEAEDKVKTLNDTLKSISGQAAKEASETAGLLAVLKSETETRERKLAALKELKTIQPEIFGQLKLEGQAVTGLDAAYKKYIENLRLVITAKLKQAQLESTTQRILEKEGLTLTKSQKDGLAIIKNITSELNKQTGQAIKTGNATAGQLIIQQKFAEKQQNEVNDLNNLYKDQAQLIKDLTELSKGIKIDIDTQDGKADFDKFINDVISRARQFAKEFGNAFVVPELEESFFVNKEEIFKRATKLLDDVSKGNLKIKLPVLVEFELIPEPEGVLGKQFNGKNIFISDAEFEKIRQTFRESLRQELNIPIEITPDLSLSKESLAKITQKLDLRKQFSILGDFGLSEFNKIDFSNINEGISEATKRLQGMMEIATTLNQAIGQGLTGAFNAVFDSILEGKNVFKALGNAIKELVVNTIKAVAQMLILKAVTSLIFPGGGGIIGAGRGAIGGIGFGSFGQANFGGLSGIGSRAFSNVIQIVGSSRISGNDIVTSYSRATNSSGRFG